MSNEQLTPEKRLALLLVDPQPEYIESSGRWKWPLKPPHDNDGKCPHVYTASREWWEYVPSEAKPHPWAEAIQLRDSVWYWTIPARDPPQRKKVTVEVHLRRAGNDVFPLAKLPADPDNWTSEVVASTYVDLEYEDRS